MKQLIVLALFALVFTGCDESPCYLSPVKTIGGCDKYGYCGVTLEDGTYSFAKYPVVGASPKNCY